MGEIISETVNEIKKAANTEYAMTFDSIYEFALTGDISGILPQIKQQVEYNTAISKEGLSNDYGANIGQIITLWTMKIHRLKQNVKLVQRLALMRV